MPANRPSSIRIFDSLYLGSIALNLANLVRDWDAHLLYAREELAGTGLQPETLLALSMAFFLGLSLILWFMVAHLRVGFVRYLLAALLVYEAVPLANIAEDGLGYSDIVVILALVLQTVAIAFTFRADARAWFEGFGGDGTDLRG